MNNPDPQQQNNNGIWQSILDSAQDLPSPLRFVIVFGVLLAVLFVFGPAIPNNLVPLLYILLIGGMGLYVWWEHQNTQRAKIDKLPSPEPATPKPQPIPLPTVPTPDRDDLHRRYLHDLFRSCGSLSMASIDPRAQHSQAAQLTLQSVFTALDVIDARRDEKSLEAASRRDDDKLREPALSALSRQQRLVLLGQPGSGKSTLVSFVTYCLAGEGLGHESVNLARLHELGWQLPSLLPLRVILRDYAARGLPQGQGLWAFLGSELEATGLAAYQTDLKRQLERRGGLLLLDGLDEVPQAHQRREELRQAILDFERDFPQVRILVTSRPYAYDADWQLPNFARADLLDFNKEQIENYIDSWYTVTSQLDPDLPPARALQYAEQLKREIPNNRNLSELAPRPLLLALMVSLHRWQHGGALPEKREELYDKSVDLLLDLWQRPKQLYDSQGRPTRQETSALVELGISRDDLREALSQVAFAAHHDQPELEGTADILAGKLAESLFNLPQRKQNIDLDRIINYIKERAGLLEERGVNRQGQRVYAFPHRTFQEYLAACYLLSQDTYPEKLVELARKEPERWRETVLLTAGRGGAKSQALVWQLVQHLCPRSVQDALPNIAEADWWAVFLAGRVIGDVEGLLQTKSPHLQEVLGRVQQWLVALIQEAALPPRDRAAAGEVLDRLGYLPPDLNQWRHCPGCAEDGADLWAMTYPVTNAQFELFMAAGGYKQERYWQAGRFGEWREPRYWDNATFGRERRDYPLVAVSWYEAAAYAAWLTELLARSQAHLENSERALIADLVAAGIKEVRLPKDEEWTRLAGGKTNDRCPWDAVAGPATTDEGEMVERANFNALGWGSTTPVYLYPLGISQPHGLMGMAGNVWEWTGSWYDDKQSGRVVRGGSWDGPRRDLRVSARNLDNPHYRSNLIGFRLVAPVFPGS